MKRDEKTSMLMAYNLSRSTEFFVRPLDHTTWLAFSTFAKAASNFAFSCQTTNQTKLLT